MTYVYIGTYTSPDAPADGGSEGVHQYTFDTETGELKATGVVGRCVNPSFIAIAPDNRHLYAVAEVGDKQAKANGVAAFEIVGGVGELKPLNKQASGGAGTCHISVDPRKQFVYIANYGSGSIAMYPINDDGSVGEVCDFIQHEGNSVNDKRQKGPHAHSINPSPDGAFVFAANLGTDKLYVYRLNRGERKLEAVEEIDAKGGAGPRHFTFHPDGTYAYQINELDSTIDVYSYHAKSGKLTRVQTIDTLPDGFEGANTTAEVVVHPSGRFLYGSNRGHDSLVICKVDEATGKLTVVGHEPTRGDHPRNFAIDPSGRFLLCANQNSNNIVVFGIDASTGRLKATEHEAKQGKPVCVRFWSPR